MKSKNNINLKGGMLTVISAFIVHLTVGIIELILAVITGSAALFAESIHSLADIANSVLLIIGDKKARERADKVHNFGHYRAKYVFSLIVAVVLFTFGGITAIKESYNKLIHPHELNEGVAISIGVLLFCLALYIISFIIDIREDKKLKSSEQTWMQFFRETRYSEAILMTGEDFAAIAGTLFALTGIIGTQITGNTMYDSGAGFAVGVLLIVMSLKLGRKFYSLILGESVLPHDRQKILTIFENNKNVNRLINLKTSFVSPEELLVCCKVELNKEHNKEDYETINILENDIRKIFNDIHCSIYIEIDKFQEDYDNKCNNPKTIT